MWHRSLYDTVKQAKERGLCLYGAGVIGNAAYRIFAKMGVIPECYCDDAAEKYESDKLYNGIPVYSLEYAKYKYPNAVYIVCTDHTRVVGKNNKDDLNKMLGKLKQYGLYDANSEMRIAMYLFVLDIGKLGESLTFDEMTEGGLIRQRDIKKILVLNHMGNSGSYYFEQLLDSHSEILCFPYCAEVYEKVYENRLRFLEGEELLIEMAAQMLGYFHSKYESMDCVQNGKFGNYCRDSSGEFLYDCLIDPQMFMGYLKKAFEGEVKLKSCGEMFKIYFASYNNCLGKRKVVGKDYWMLYHMHIGNYNVAEMYDKISPEDFERFENVLIIREPVQHWFSWVKHLLSESEAEINYLQKVQIAPVLYSEMGNMTEKKPGYTNVKVVRFEDIKYHARESMVSLCKWLDIPFEDILLETTLNGYNVYFPAFTEEGIKYITGQDTTAVQRKNFREVMSLWDETRLNMIFAKFKKAYGYETGGVPAFTEFNKAFIGEILDANFKFADLLQRIIDDNGMDSEWWYDINEFTKALYQNYMENYQEKEYYEWLKPEMIENDE